MSRDPPDQARLGQLAEEQAALRRVATLVAQATPPEEVFAAVAEEVGQLFRVELATLCRYEPGRMWTPVTTWGPAGKNLPVGIRWPLEGHNVSTLVFESGRPARIDRYADSSSGPVSAAPREIGSRSAVGTPVLVEGHLWGVIFAGSTQEQPLPPDTETRLASFTELVATAIAVPAWPASPTASRPWAARSASTALPGPGRTSPRTFHLSTSWLRVPAERSDCPACGRRRERRVGGDGGTAPLPAGSQAGPLLTGSRIGRQSGRNKGSHAPAWNSRELWVTHERCRWVLRRRPLRSLSQASVWLTARTCLS